MPKVRGTTVSRWVRTGRVVTNTRIDVGKLVVQYHRRWKECPENAPSLYFLNTLGVKPEGWDRVQCWYHRVYGKHGKQMVCGRWSRRHLREKRAANLAANRTALEQAPPQPSTSAPKRGATRVRFAQGTKLH